MNIDFLILMKPELMLIALIFILLTIKVWDGIKSNAALLTIANFLMLLNVAAGFVGNGTGTLFNGMYMTGDLIALEKNILNIGTFLIFLQSYDSLKKHKHLLEFYILIVTTLMGMEYMISAGNFLMFFLGLELASIPLAALANFDTEKPKSAESGVKLILSSAFASGIMLFGISMLYGTTGTLNFAEMSMRLSAASQLQIFAFIVVFAGFAFKLSAVPFHLWTADVYEGAPVAVTAYLSVISKGAVVFVFGSILYKLFAGYAGLWYNMLSLTIMLTITVGNLFALRQENIKRFLAFSSITQVGYILLGISAGTGLGMASAVFFMIVYVFSNLGAFGIVSWIADSTGKENISDYNGLYANNKFASWILALSLFSLAGIPPTAGFFAKMFLVTAGAARGNYLLVGLAALNMVISLYYYLRVVRAVFIEKNETPIGKLESSFLPKVAMAVCVAGIVGTGFVTGFFEYINTLTAR